MKRLAPAATLGATAWAAGAAAGCVLVPPGRPAAALGAAMLVLAGVALAAAVVLRPPLGPLLLALLLAGLARGALPGLQPPPVERARLLAGTEVVLTGTVADDPRPAGAGVEVIVQPETIRSAHGSPAPAGSVLVRVRGAADVAVGDRVEAAGRLALPGRTPDFDRRAYLLQRGATLELATQHLGVTASAGGVRALPGWLREHYRRAVLELLPPPHGAVLVGIVLGVRDGIPPSLQAALVATGLVHLLVLSGLKVAVFARLAAAALSPLLGRAAVFPVLAAIALYALAGGATPAALRASLMGGLSLLAAWLGRPAHVWTSLAWTAAGLLAWRPELAWDIGFQLSFAGTAAIVLLTPALESRLARVPRVLREPFAVTLAAQLGTLPMTAAGFHVLSPVAPLANAVTLPLLPVIVGLGLLVAPLALLPDAGRLAALPLDGMLAYVQRVAELLARVPGAAVPVPAFPAWAGAAYFTGLGAALAAVRTAGRSRRLSAAAAVALPLAIGAAELGAWTWPSPTAAVLAVGGGEAVLVSGAEGAILVGAGASPARLASEVGARLPPWRRRLSLLAIEGGSAGQVGGLVGSGLRADAVLLPEAGAPGSAWRAAALAQAAGGARLVRGAAGDHLRAAGFEVTVLAPEPGTPVGAVGATDLALRIARPGGRAICTFGNLDAGAQAQAALRLRGRCQALVLPGQGRSLPAPALLAAAGATDLVATSAGGRLARGLPAAGLRRLDQEGTVTFEL